MIDFWTTQLSNAVLCARKKVIGSQEVRKGLEHKKTLERVIYNRVRTKAENEGERSLEEFSIARYGGTEGPENPVTGGATGVATLHKVCETRISIEGFIFT